MPVTTRKRVTWGDFERIGLALGLSLGEYTSRDDDSRGLAFTVCGGKRRNGTPAPEWLQRMNGMTVDDIAEEAIKRNAVKPIGRWEWETTL